MLPSRLIIGNWKMHGLRADVERLAGAVAEFYAREEPRASCALCPPATLARLVAERLRGVEGVFVGGQDCHEEDAGAHTGDVSAVMLKDAGCAYVIVGHSERRIRHGEDDALVRRKAETARRAGLIPVLCVGETLEQREKNLTLEVIVRQIGAGAPEGEPVIVAYEPVWAIGTGRTPSLRDIEAAHGTIRACLTERKKMAPERALALYGGSVKAANAREILQVPGVGGALVGGASLEAEEFCAILAAASTA